MSLNYVNKYYGGFIIILNWVLF